MKPAYYNEIDPYCCQWLRNLINAGHLPPGDVDERDIRAVQPDDLAGYGQRHLFAGVGGFGLACRLAGLPDDFDVLTGGFPCQPFSVAGRQLAQSDDRHLWPEMHRLVEQTRPAWVLGENVAGFVSLALDGVQSDLDAAGYGSRAFVLPACAVDAPHRRDRVWIAARRVADACGIGCTGGQDAVGGHDDDRTAAGRGQGADRAALRREDGGALADASEQGRRGRGICGPDESLGADEEWPSGQPSGCGEGGGDVGHADGAGSPARSAPAKAARHGRTAVSTDWSNPWTGAEYRQGADGKARRVEPGIRLLDARIPARVAKLRAGGNAIVPQVAAEILRAMMEHRP